MKKVWAMLLVALLLMTMIPLGAVSVAANRTSGTIGECTWVWEDRHLTISGEGCSMGEGNSPSPWGTNVASVTIADGVTSIRNGAFEGCWDLKRVEIPDSVTTIGKRAFYNCSALTEISVGKNNTWYYSEDGVLFGGKNSIFNERYLVKCPAGKSGDYTIPDGVTHIDEEAFSNCYSLTSVTIPDSMTTIGKAAFAGCGSLTTVTIPNSVTAIPEKAFQSCSSLISVTIGNSVKTIGERAFSFCALNSLVIPNHVTTIKEYAFEYCRDLISVTVGDGAENIGDYAFYNCTSLASLTLGDSVDSIGWSAFDQCTSLTSVMFPDNVDIGRDAFRGCVALTSVTIGGRYTDISWNVFDGCDALTTVHYHGSERDRAAMEIDASNDNLTNATWHYYDNICDAGCNVCETVRMAPHDYYNLCDSRCDACGEVRDAHVYDGACDAYCNVCDFRRMVPDHDYRTMVVAPTCTNGGYTAYTCVVCGDSYITDETAALGHVYDNACDDICDLCSEVREIPDHVYDNDQDADCNECGFVRVIGKPITITLEVVGEGGSMSFVNYPDQTSIVLNPRGEEGNYINLDILISIDPGYYGRPIKVNGEVWEDPRNPFGPGDPAYLLDNESHTTGIPSFAATEDTVITLEVAPADRITIDYGDCRALYTGRYADEYSWHENGQYWVSECSPTVLCRIPAFCNADYTQYSKELNTKPDGTGIRIPTNSSHFYWNSLPEFQNGKSDEITLYVITECTAHEEYGAVDDSWVYYEEKPATCTEGGYAAHRYCPDCGRYQMINDRGYYSVVHPNDVLVEALPHTYVDGVCACGHKGVTLGDVTGDGKINNRDLGLLQQYINGWGTAIDAAAADVTADGKVNNRDLGLLQQYINGWGVELG